LSARPSVSNRESKRGEFFALFSRFRTNFAWQNLPNLPRFPNRSCMQFLKPSASAGFRNCLRLCFALFNGIDFGVLWFSTLN
jgi:hypothetical protein